MSNLIFVGGAPRSGTGLVMYLLNLHPDCFLLGEAHPMQAQLTALLAATPAGKLVGDKSPLYSLTWQQLRNWFPDCLLVFTHRDFNATVNSIMRQHWAPATREDAESDVRYRVRNMKKADRSLIIGLEDLEADPEPGILSLLEYAGLDPGQYDLALGADVVRHGNVNRSASCTI